MHPQDRDRAAAREFLHPRTAPGEFSSQPATSGERVASHLVLRAARRLEIVCIATIISTMALWFVVNLALGSLADEFRSLHQWVPPVTALAASALVLALARSRRLSPLMMVRLGLVYEVVVSFAFVTGSSLGAFQGMAASDLAIDRIGPSFAMRSRSVPPSIYGIT